MSQAPFRRVEVEPESDAHTYSREIRFAPTANSQHGTNRQHHRRNSVEADLAKRISQGSILQSTTRTRSDYETLTDLEKDCRGTCQVLSAIWDRHWHISRAEMLEHVSRRLEWHVQQMQSRALGGSNGEHVSGVWIVPAVLNQMHHEFKDSDPFVRNVAGLIDRCVQDVIGDRIDDSGGVFHAPWTSQGASVMETYMDYLAQLGEDNKGGPSVYRALQKIRRAGDGDEDVIEDVEASETFVKEKLFPPGGPKAKPEWGGFFTRPFQIGVVALFKRKDYKTLVQIIRGAKFYRDHIKQNEAAQAAQDECVDAEGVHSNGQAFYWTEDVISLAGMHLSKFDGDSDTHFILTRRLNKVMDHTLPMIAQFLNCCSGNVRHTCTVAMECQLVLLAALFASLNAIMSMLSNSEGLDTYIKSWTNAHFGNWSARI